MFEFTTRPFLAKLQADRQARLRRLALNTLIWFLSAFVFYGPMLLGYPWFEALHIAILVTLVPIVQTGTEVRIMKAALDHDSKELSKAERCAITEGLTLTLKTKKGQDLDPNKSLGLFSRLASEGVGGDVLIEVGRQRDPDDGGRFDA